MQNSSSWGGIQACLIFGLGHVIGSHTPRIVKCIYWVWRYECLLIRLYRASVREKVIYKLYIMSCIAYIQLYIVIPSKHRFLPRRVMFRHA